MIVSWSFHYTMLISYSPIISNHIRLCTCHHRHSLKQVPTEWTGGLITGVEPLVLKTKQWAWLLKYNVLNTISYAVTHIVVFVTCILTKHAEWNRFLQVLHCGLGSWQLVAFITEKQMKHSSIPSNFLSTFRFHRDKPSSIVPFYKQIRSINKIVYYEQLYFILIVIIIILYYFYGWLTWWLRYVVSCNIQFLHSCVATPTLRPLSTAIAPRGWLLARETTSSMDTSSTTYVAITSLVLGRALIWNNMWQFKTKRFTYSQIL